MSTTINKTCNFDVRDSLKKTIFEVFLIMKSKGWFFEYKPPSSNSKGHISFQKEYDWNGKPQLAFNPSYGYFIESVESIDITVQRAAELCLRVYELFTHSIPGNPNIYGEIRDDFVLNQPKYADLKYDEFIASHKDKEFTLYDTAPWLCDAFYFTYYSFTVTIKKSEIERLLSEIDYSLKLFNGDLPVAS